MGHCITRHQQEVQEDTAKYAKNDTTNSDADETKLHALIGNDPENLISPASSAYYEFIDHKSWKRQAMYSKDFETLVTTDKRPIIREPQECKVTMTNCTQVPLYLCWVDYDGMLLHHQPVHPPGYIQDGSSESRVCHFSQAGHAFCFYVLPDCATSKPNRHELTLVESTSDSDASADHRHAEAYKMPLLHHIHDIPLENFVCAYRPLQFLEARDGQSGPADATLATPSHELTARADPSARHASDIKVQIHVHIPSPDHSIQTLALRDVKYASTTCAGFQVFHEIGQFATISEREFTSPTYLEARQTRHYEPTYALYALHDDLCRISQLLPPHALQLLQARTAVYLNMQRLPDCPETAHTCYHPTGSKRWLLEHALPASHEHCIEIFDAVDYVQSRLLWGTGGLLLHELCHAFHDQQLADGYQNMTLQTAYQRAMHLGLYNEVCVHTVEGMSADGSYTRALRGPLRGYCCNDVMEFFAELSVAFLCEEDVDFNKWEPCNRGQLQQRDPHTLRVLESLWAP